MERVQQALRWIFPEPRIVEEPEEYEKAYPSALARALKDRQMTGAPFVLLYTYGRVAIQSSDASPPTVISRDVSSHIWTVI